MKKIVMLFSLLAVVMLSLASCDRKKSNSEAAEVFGGLVAEHTISADREYMYMHFGDNYRWFETCVQLKDFLDEGSDGSIENITNIFQYVEMDEKGGDAEVIFSIYKIGVHEIEAKHAFWIEDHPLNYQKIKLTFKEAFDKMMATNYPKPHSRQAVLRLPVGPRSCNPQYIFGNIESQLYVDATTGEVTDKNPAFEGFDN